MSHYYTNDSSLDSKRMIVTYTFKGHNLSLLTDLGVFSKTRVDFGTNVLLNALPDFSENSKILDVGCGYGIIGLSLAKRYPKSEVVLVDVNDRAITLTKENIKRNNISNARAFISDLYENVDEEFDYIISNPPIRAGKMIVHQIVSNGINRLKKDGCMFLVVQKKQGAPSLIKKMEEVFGNVQKIEQKNGYCVIFSRKN